jgi:hypothetical protein
MANKKQMANVPVKLVALTVSQAQALHIADGKMATLEEP